MMRCVLLVELGVHWHRNLVRQTVRRRQSIFEDDSGNEATFNSFSVLDNDVTSINDGLLVGITLIVQPRAASKQRDQGLKMPLERNSVYPRLTKTCPYVKCAVEPLGKLSTTVVLVP
jgi:hypothetical protein